MGWGRAGGGSLFHCNRMGGHHYSYKVYRRDAFYVKGGLSTELYCVPLPASIKFQILLT